MTEPPTVERQVVGALGSIGVATLTSRVLGFARDMIVALAFGAGPVTDAFFVAFARAGDATSSTGCSIATMPRRMNCRRMQNRHLHWRGRAVSPTPRLLPQRWAGIETRSIADIQPADFTGVRRRGGTIRQIAFVPTADQAPSPRPGGMIVVGPDGGSPWHPAPWRWCWSCSCS